MAVKPIELGDRVVAIAGDLPRNVEFRVIKRAGEKVMLTDGELPPVEEWRKNLRRVD